FYFSIIAFDCYSTYFYPFGKTIFVHDASFPQEGIQSPKILFCERNPFLSHQSGIISLGYRFGNIYFGLNSGFGGQLLISRCCLQPYKIRAVKDHLVPLHRSTARISGAELDWSESSRRYTWV